MSFTDGSISGDERTSVGRDTGTVQDAGLRGIAYAHVGGQHAASTPSGEITLISSKPFLLSETSPLEAVMQADKHWRNMELHAAHWTLISAFACTALRRAFDYLFMFRCDDAREQWLRQRAGMDDTRLDNVWSRSWHLARCVLPNTEDWEQKID
jgi:hypothetical protein